MSISFFLVGATIFAVYVYMLLTVIVGQHRKQRREHKSAYDLQDNEGHGNYGRIPDKKPKNRV